MSRSVVPESELPHLLESYASYCVTLAEQCEQPRTARWLRILSVDLALAAERLRRLAPATGQTESPSVRSPQYPDRELPPRPYAQADDHASPERRVRSRLPSLIVAVLVFWLFGSFSS
jgi:hypothetical protein